MKASLIAPIVDVEIKNALFVILDNKSPGPYGYTSLFFKRSQEIIGANFRATVHYFFTTSKLSRCVNAAKIALIPKVESPMSMSDFRPISYCNVRYKYISKVLANRFKGVLPNIIRYF